MIRLGLVRPQSVGSQTRGGGFYVERLHESLKKIKELDIEEINFSRNPIAYLKYDLVHFAFFDPFAATLPPLRFKKSVVTVHDLIPLKFPDHFPLGKKAKVFWLIQKGALKTVDTVITDSEASKKDIATLTGYPPQKIHVAYLAADPEFKKIPDKAILASMQKKFNLPSEFVLYVGGVNWNKNLTTLVRACQKANVNLILVGKEFLNIDADFSHVELQPFKEVLELIKNDTKVQRLGFVPTKDLVGIYNLASVYAQPSVYEGFGLPVLEAMSCGTPVVCGRNSSLSEIMGDVAIYADVTDPSELALKILRLFKLPRGERDKIGQKGLARAKKFSWKKTAEQTYETYQKVLAGE